MGGLGSGKQFLYDRKETVERCEEIDVQYWNREGYLIDLPFPITLSTIRNRWGRLEIRAILSRNKVFIYHWFLNSRRKAGVTIRSYTVPIDRTDCNFGGKRPWFICPGVFNGRACKRRVVKLYRRDGCFLCRHCHDLTYEARQSRNRYAVTLRRCQSIRRRLGGSTNLMEPFPKRPKGMHFKTYMKLLQEHNRAQRECNHLLFVKLSKMTFLPGFGE